MTCVARQRLHTMLHTRLSLKFYNIPSYTRTPQRVYNGTASAYEFIPHSTSTESRIPCHSFKSSPTSYARESLHSRRSPFKNKLWSNNSAPWAKISRPLGAQTHDLTERYPSNFVRDDSLQPTRENILRLLDSSHCQYTSSTPLTPPQNLDRSTDLDCIVFFFLLRPGNHCQGSTYTVSTLFRLLDIQLVIVN